LPTELYGCGFGGENIKKNLKNGRIIMDLLDYAEYKTIEVYTRLNFGEFEKTQNYKITYSRIVTLFRIYYLVELKGDCWEKEIFLCLEGSRMTRVRLAKTIRDLIHSGLVERVEEKRGFGRNVRITRKGLHAIRAYQSWFLELRERLHLNIRSVGAEYRDLKKK
jgi:DNA-binding MarR family transcriptional regulator